MRGRGGEVCDLPGLGSGHSFCDDSCSGGRVCASGQERGDSVRGRFPERLMTASCSILRHLFPFVEQRPARSALATGGGDAAVTGGAGVGSAGSDAGGSAGASPRWNGASSIREMKQLERVKGGLSGRAVPVCTEGSQRRVAAEAEISCDIGEESDRAAGAIRLEDCIWEICFAWPAAMEI
eukprot:superscaffoldBa00000747_g6967